MKDGPRNTSPEKFRFLNFMFSHDGFFYMFSVFFLSFFLVFPVHLRMSSQFNPSGSYSGRATASLSSEGLIAPLLFSKSSEKLISFIIGAYKT